MHCKNPCAATCGRDVRMLSSTVKPGLCSTRRRCCSILSTVLFRVAMDVNDGGKKQEASEKNK